MKYFGICLAALFLASCFRLSKSDEGKPGFKGVSPTGMGSGLSTLVYPTPIWTPSPAPTPSPSPSWTPSPEPSSTPRSSRSPTPTRTPWTLPRAQVPTAAPTEDTRRIYPHLEIQGFAFSPDLTAFEQNGVADFMGGAGTAAVFGGYFGEEGKSALGALVYWANFDPTVNAVTLSSGPLHMHPVMLRFAARSAMPPGAKWSVNGEIGAGINWAQHGLDGAVQDKCRAAGYECSESIEWGWGMSLGAGISRHLAYGLSLGLQLDYFSFIHQANFGAKNLATGDFRGQSLQVNFGWLSLSPKVSLTF